MTTAVRILLSTFLICFLFSTSEAQTFKAFMKAGKKADKEKNYSAALQYYQEAMTFKASDPDLWFRYAEVARKFNAYEEADTYYQKILNSKLQDRFPLTAFWLATVKKSTGHYDAAKSLFQDYIKQEGAVNDYVAKAKEEIEACEYALALMDDADNVEINKLNKRINSPYSEFGPLLVGDTLYYSSFRYKNDEDEHDPPRKITKVLTSVKGVKGKPLSRGFNNKELHTAHTAFNKNKSRIYFTICKYLNATEINCEIFYREKDKRKHWTKKPVKLPETINVPGFTATQPCIGFDESGKELLYFVSNKTDGVGGLDIWYTEVDGEKFGKPENVKSVNTEGNDITPFWHQESKVLYFSSDYRKGMGGYDIFKSQKNGTDWSEVEHTGYPLNSSYNDLYFTMNADSSSAHFASNRIGSFYLEKTNKACCNDIYHLAFLEDNTPITEDSLIVVLIPDPDPISEPEPQPILEPEPKEPVVTTGLPPVKEKVPNTLEEFLPLALYFHNDEPDKRTRRTSTKKSYEETYHPYYALKGEYQREYTKPMSETDRYQGEDEVTYFFENKVRKGYEHLNRFSEILLARLEEGEQLEIFVKGYTSPRATSDYNISLGKRRISSVKNHFDVWRAGIFQVFINKGQLIISERSFGETTASNTISDDLYDLRNSIYHPNAATERRVEIVEIKRN